MTHNYHDTKPGGCQNPGSQWVKNLFMFIFMKGILLTFIILSYRVWEGPKIFIYK